MRTRLSTLWLALTLAAVACTGETAAPSPIESTTTTSPPATTTTTLVGERAVDVFRNCLAANGVDIDPIELDAKGRPRLDQALSGLDLGSDDSAAAMAACADILGSGALNLSQGDILRWAVVERLDAFADCVRRNGVGEFPDPIPGFSGVGSPFPAAEIPYEHPGLGAAVEICRAQILGTLDDSG